MHRSYSLTDDLKFSYKIENFDQITTVDYLGAINKSVISIIDEMNVLSLKRVGLCLSGSDSELIAHYLHLNNVPTEYFFLDVENINSLERKLCEEISKKYNTKLNVISITIEELLDKFIYENFNITPVCYPTYATLPTLIKQIPNDYYIITGEGDIEKGWKRYKIIFNKIITDYNSDYFYVPVHLSEIAYNRALNFYQKHGESNFYSRCFDTWYHLLNHPDMITNGIDMYDPKTKIISKVIKDLKLLSPEKTMNYNDTDINHELRYNIGQTIISKLTNVGNNLPGWSRNIGDVIKVPKTLIYTDK